MRRKILGISLTICYDPVMYKDAIQFTSDNECYTPKSVVRFFGAFDYDPATTTEKAKEFKIPNYDTIETDGLSKDWSYRRIWINPPFTLKYDFLKKAVEANKKYGNDIYILLPIGFMTTKKFHDAMSGWGGQFTCRMGA